MNTLDVRVNRSNGTVEVGSNKLGGISSFETFETLTAGEALYWSGRLREAAIVAARIALGNHRANVEHHAGEVAELEAFLRENGGEA